MNHSAARAQAIEPTAVPEAPRRLAGHNAAQARRRDCLGTLNGLGFFRLNGFFRCSASHSVLRRKSRQLAETELLRFLLTEAALPNANDQITENTPFKNITSQALRLQCAQTAVLRSSKC